jgi:uncharacterized membrane protein
MDFSGIFEFIIPLAERLPVLRAIIGFILVFFLPGFVWTLVFFSQVNIIERIALSFGLSIAVLTLGIIVLHVILGISITGFNAVLFIGISIIIALVFYFLKWYLARS